MMMFNEKEVEDIQMAKAALVEERKDKFNEILDKSKKALMYDGPVFGVGGLAYLYKKSQEANDTMTRK